MAHLNSKGSKQGPKTPSFFFWVYDLIATDIRLSVWLTS